jgi:hypothetical protein
VAREAVGRAETGGGALSRGGRLRKRRRRDGAPLWEEKRMRRRGLVGLLAWRRAARWLRRQLGHQPEEGEEGAGRVAPNDRGAG